MHSCQVLFNLSYRKSSYNLLMRVEEFNKHITHLFLKNYKDQTNEEMRSLSTSVLIFAQGILVGSIFAPIQYIAGGWTLLNYCLIVIFTGFLSLFLIQFNETKNFSRLLFIFVCNFLVLFNSKSVGISGGVQFFFAPAISLPFLMFNAKQRKSDVLISIFLPIFLGSILYLFPLLDIVPQISLTTGTIKAYGFMSTMLALLMVSFSVYHFYLMVEDRDLAIIEKNKQIFNSEKLASLGILSSGIAHEINNPLAVIVGTALQLKRDVLIENEYNEEFLKKLEKITKMTERINNIVKSLKTYNLNDSNSPLTKINLTNLVDEALTFFRKDMEVMEISYIIEVIKPHHVLAKESDLLQVLINLFSNSIDAIKDKQEKRWIKISISEKFNTVYLVFTDSGSGISPEILEKIFDPFYTSKKVGEGTGLGLYICRNIMEAMNGKIEYTEGTNTSFRLILNKA